MTAPELDTEQYLDDIPPYPRCPGRGARLATVNMINLMDAKIEKLAGLGLRPHPTMLGYRAELVAQMESNGPYKLRVTHMVL